MYCTTRGNTNNDASLFLSMSIYSWSYKTELHDLLGGWIEEVLTTVIILPIMLTSLEKSVFVMHGINKAPCKLSILNSKLL